MDWELVVQERSTKHTTDVLLEDQLRCALDMAIIFWEHKLPQIKQQNCLWVNHFSYISAHALIIK